MPPCVAKSPSHILQLLLVNPEAFTGQMGYVLPPALPRGLLPTERALNTCTERRPDQMPEPPQQPAFTPKQKLCTLFPVALGSYDGPQCTLS